MELSSLEIKVSRSENLAVMPQVASAVLRLADDVDSSPRTMGALIERDSAIAAKVLRVANSSYYGQTEVPSIGRAITVLGMNTIRSLVVGIAYQQVISSKQNSQLFSKIDFWRHSVAVATAAKILGKIKNPAHAEEVYSTALVHDLGVLVMDRFAPDELDQAITYARQEKIALHEAEQLLFDFDHAAVGGILGEKWALSPAMASGIRYHHAPWDDPKGPENAAYVALANQLAKECGFFYVPPGGSETIPPELLEVVGIPEEQIGAIKAVVTTEVARAEALLNIK